PD
ncbi:phage terminase large subunit, partial [Escherichia coli PA23]